MQFLPNFHRMIASKYRRAYCQACVSVVFEGVIAVYLDILIKASVPNSNISHAIFTQLSQDDCQQVPQCILSGFCDLIVFAGAIALCLILHIKASVLHS